MKKIILVLNLCFIFNLGLFAQELTLKNISQIEKLSEEVVELFSKNKITPAYDKMRPYWPIPENEIDAIEDKTLKYLNIIEERFGAAFETIKIKRETISDFAIRDTYLIRYKYTAIRLIFTYYKNSDGWILNAFKWDDSYDEEFKEIE